MKIYTKTGDAGQTSLYDHIRMDKDDIRIESYGTADELNSSLGFSKNFIEDIEIFSIIEKIQRQLFNVAGELATLESEKFPEKISNKDIEELEVIIDRYIELMGSDQSFRLLLPGSCTASGGLHVSRTICKRLERRVLSLDREQKVRIEVKKYINRLADLIYTLAHYLEERPTYIEFNTD